MENITRIFGGQLKKYKCLWIRKDNKFFSNRSGDEVPWDWEAENFDELSKTVVWGGMYGYDTGVLVVIDESEGLEQN